MTDVNYMLNHVLFESFSKVQITRDLMQENVIFYCQNISHLYDYALLRLLQYFSTKFLWSLHRSMSMHDVSFCSRNSYLTIVTKRRSFGNDKIEKNLGLKFQQHHTS